MDIFSSKFSRTITAPRLIKCVKQKSSELILLSNIKNNRNKAKDLLISTFNNYKYTSTGFSIASYEKSLYQTSLNFIKDKTNNIIKSSIYTKNNNNNENNLINNDKINFNTIETQSSKSNKSIIKNSNYLNNIKNDNNSNQLKTIDTLPITEVKKENIIYNNKLGFLRKSKKNANTIIIKNNLKNLFQKNIFNYKSSANNNDKSKKYLKLITKNDELIESQTKNNLHLLFNHDNDTNIKVFDYIEKDYYKNQKEKIENIILKDEFNNHSCNNTKLINIKINFLDNEITNFMENKYDSLTSDSFFILSEDILYNKENKEKEQKLYTNFKSKKIYIDNKIHMDFNENMLKKNIKMFGFSNKIKNIDTNMSLYKSKANNNKGMKTHIIQYINKHYDLFRLIYKDIIIKNVSLNTNKNYLYISNKIVHKKEIYNVLKNDLFLSLDFIKLNQKFQNFFKNIEIKREDAWNELNNIENNSMKQSLKGKKAIININKVGRKQTSYTSLLKDLKSQKSLKKEKEKVEKQTAFSSFRRSLSITRNIFNKQKRDIKKGKRDSKFSYTNIQKTKTKTKTKFAKLNIVNNINQNKSIIIEENTINDKKRKSEPNKNEIKCKVIINEDETNNNNDDNHEMPKLKDFEKSNNKVTKFKLCLNKLVFGRNKNTILKTETLESKINKLLKEENKKTYINNLSNKSNNEMIKFSGYDTLTQESMIIKMKELEERKPLAKLFNQFLLLIEKGREVLFEELLEEEEKNFAKAGKNITEFLNGKNNLTGNTLLIYAVQKGEKNIVQSLLKRKVDPNIQNIFGNTALHVAYKENAFNMVCLLRQFGASNKIKNKNGATPTQMTFFNEHII